MKRILLTSLILFLFIGNSIADELSFTASAPKSVVLNQPFRLSYTINSNVNSEPLLADMPGFKVIAGPAFSVMNSSYGFNGNNTSSVEVTFTYTLLPIKEGEFTLPGAKISVNGEQLASNALKIKVLPEGQSSASGTRNQGRRTGGGASTEIGDDEIFVRATLSKSTVYEQEAVLLSYKLYFMRNISDLRYPSLPQLKGLNVQEVKLSANNRPELEHYNGRNYSTLLLRQYVLFPLNSGEVTIPSLEFEAIVNVAVPGGAVDPWGIFGSYTRTVEVNKKLNTKAQKITVKPLPAGKPSGYYGGVGKFSVKSALNDSVTSTNNEFTLKITVDGTGNLNLVGNPEIELPDGFEMFEPVVTNNYKLTASGFKGEKVYEYQITPKSSGDFVMSSLKYSYFDTSAKKYRTLETDSFKIKVERASAAVPVSSGQPMVSKEKGRIIDTDIRHIMPGNDLIEGGEGKIYTSALYVAAYPGLILLFILLLVAERKRVAKNANVLLVRNKKANKVAVKRLKVAKKLMKENRMNEFYDEILKAMWGYVSDKLSIPVAMLTKDNISNELLAKGVSEGIVNEFKEVLDEGEFARYAPGDKEAAMEKVFSMSIKVISKIEDSI